MGTYCGIGRQHSAPDFDLVLLQDPAADPTSALSRSVWVAWASEEREMSDTFQILLDSGAFYLAIGAVICVVLGLGAARRLFRGARKFERGTRNKQVDR